MKVAKLHVLLPISPPWGGYPCDHCSLGGGKDYSLVDRGLWEHEATYVQKQREQVRTSNCYPAGN